MTYEANINRMLQQAKYVGLAIYFVEDAKEADYSNGVVIQADWSDSKVEKELRQGLSGWAKAQREKYKKRPALRFKEKYEAFQVPSNYPLQIEKEVVLKNY